MLYSSNLSLYEYSGKIHECTVALVTLPIPQLSHMISINKLVEKQPFQFLSFLEVYFTYSRVGERAWRGLSDAIKIPCEM